MGGKVNSRKPQMKLVGGSGDGTKKDSPIPSPHEVFKVARSAVQEMVGEVLDVARSDTAHVAKVLGEKIAMLYTEEVKTAIMVNSLVEILIEKGILTKDEFKSRVDKNSAETQQMYQRATEAVRTAKPPAQPEPGGADANGREQEVGG